MKAILLTLAVVLCAGFGYAYSSGEPIPAWIKQVAGFWAEDKITDSEFVAALEFLIRQGAIQVDDSERVFELREKNRVLRERIALLESGGTHPGEASGSTAVFARGVLLAIDELPDIQNATIPANAIKRATAAWEQVNPRMSIKDVNTVRILWSVGIPTEHVGLALCTASGTCVLEIWLGGYDCNGDFVQYDEDSVTNTIMHEIGHTLGLNHTSDEQHLMYGTDYVQDDFDTLGYVIPDRLDGWFVGQEEIVSTLDGLDAQIGTLKSEWGELNVEYEPYVNKSQPLTAKEYTRAMELYDRLNQIADELDRLIVRYNEIFDLYGCYPNLGA